MKRKVFFSFHYKNDAWRTSEVREIGVIEGQKLFSDNDWEEVKRKGDKAIKEWIDENMKNRSCVIVLVGSETANRKYVKYEIKHAWETGKGIVGIDIHKLKDSNRQPSKKGTNPFDNFCIDKRINFIAERQIPADKNEINLSSTCRLYEPTGTDSKDVYADIQEHIERLIEEAIAIRSKYPK